MYDAKKAAGNVPREPLPGYWYINHTGQLIRVRLVAYGMGGIETILLQDIEGITECINIRDWYDLDLVVPSYDQSELLLGSDSRLQ